MAARKKTTKTDAPAKPRKTDAATLAKLQSLASRLAEQAEREAEPRLTIPSRTLTNAHYNVKKKFIEMGDKTTDRELFNLSQARSFMQTMVMGSTIKSVIDINKTASLRALFYNSKHDVAGSKQSTFEKQEESDPIIEDLEVALDALREELHIFAEPKGAIAGPITINDRGRDFDCMEMPSAGFPVPSIVEPDVVQFKKVKAKFILHVEKGTVWQRFYEDGFHEEHKCIISHGGGQPPRGVRRLLYRLHNEHKLPVYCLLDNDPWGHYIYSVIKQGSINLAFESQRMAVPEARFIGIRSRDYEDFELGKNVQIKMNDRDEKRAKQILEYDWFKTKKEWQKEIKAMIQHGFKMEVEALANKNLSFVTEEYVPTKLKRKDWLD